MRVQQRAVNEQFMRKVKENGLRPEYKLADFRGKGVRGKYYKRMIEGPTNVVVLDPDVAEAFPNSRVVHKALRSLMRGRRPRRAPRKRAA